MGMRPMSKGRPKSKRQTLKDKYKIQRKVKEHNRKKRKQERLNGKTKLKKDPGVPSMHPLRKEIIKEIQEAKEMAEQERMSQKERQREQMKQKIMDLETLQRDAESRSHQYETARDMEKLEGKKELKDTSRRSFFKEFASVIEEADVILQVLDARDPIASRSELVENAILECRGTKKLILVLNKIDLVPRSVTMQWLKYFRNEFPTIAFKASTQSQRTNLSQGTSLASSQGGATLMKLLKNYGSSQGLKKTITVGVVGYPNVGKSSIINSLKRKKVTGVGQLPGITRHTQRVMLEKNIFLLDSPGIVFSSKSDLSSLVLRNCVRMDALENPVSVIDRLLHRCDVSQIMEFYGLPSFDSTTEFLQLLAKRLGKLKKGGIPNIDASANQVLHDFHTGKVSYFSQPPAEYKPENQLSAEIVSEWGEAFDIGSVYVENDGMLKTLPDKKDIKKSRRFEFFPSERLTDDVGTFRLGGGVDAEENDEDMEDEEDEEDMDEDERRSEKE
eukprot:m.59552 g.59552  ORF g.59552 m.59552 type:complete len:502 (-) comp7911_c0_seq7:2235-3740(-)